MYASLAFFYEEGDTYASLPPSARKEGCLLPKEGGNPGHLPCITSRRALSLPSKHAHSLTNAKSNCRHRAIIKNNVPFIQVSYPSKVNEQDTLSKHTFLHKKNFFGVSVKSQQMAICAHNRVL